MFNIKLCLGCFFFIILSECLEDMLAKTTAFEYDRNEDGGYAFSYNTDNGILRSEAGKFEMVDGRQVLRVMGFYKYAGDDGKDYLVHYKADEQGYQPEISVLSEDDLTFRIDKAAIASLIGGGLG